MQEDRLEAYLLVVLEVEEIVIGVEGECGCFGGTFGQRMTGTLDDFVFVFLTT